MRAKNRYSIFKYAVRDPIFIVPKSAHHQVDGRHFGVLSDDILHMVKADSIENINTQYLYIGICTTQAIVTTGLYEQLGNIPIQAIRVCKVEYDVYCN